MHENINIKALLRGLISMAWMYICLKYCIYRHVHLAYMIEILLKNKRHPPGREPGISCTLRKCVCIVLLGGLIGFGN